MSFSVAIALDFLQADRGAVLERQIVLVVAVVDDYAQHGVNRLAVPLAVIYHCRQHSLAHFAITSSQRFGASAPSPYSQSSLSQSVQQEPHFVSVQRMSPSNPVTCVPSPYSSSS